MQEQKSDSVMILFPPPPHFYIDGAEGAGPVPNCGFRFCSPVF